MIDRDRWSDGYRSQGGGSGEWLVASGERRKRRGKG